MNALEKLEQAKAAFDAAMSIEAGKASGYGMESLSEDTSMDLPDPMPLDDDNYVPLLLEAAPDLLKLARAARRLSDAQAAYETEVNQPPGATGWREAGATLAMASMDFHSALEPLFREVPS